MALKLKDSGATRFKSGVVIPSGDYKAADPDAVDIDTHGANCLRVNVNISAVSGAGATATATISGIDSDGTTLYTLLTKAHTATGVIPMVIGPTIAASAGVAANAPLPAKVRVAVVGSGTRTTLTYSVSAEVS